MRDAILEKLALILENTPNQVGPDDNLSELGLDSIKFISLVVMLEETFNIEFDDELLLIDRMNTLRKIDDALQEMMSREIV